MIRGRLLFLRPDHSRRPSSVCRVPERQARLLRKAEPEGMKEFMRSSDFNSRFVNTTTGLTVASTSPICTVASFRTRPWFNEGNRRVRPPHRSEQAHSAMGRIWRIRHKDHQPLRGKAPHARGIDTSRVGCDTWATNPIGWWSEYCPKAHHLYETDREKAVFPPAARSLARFSQNPLATFARSCGLLEGLEVLDSGICHQLI